jgi:hypothetical protein
MKAEKSISVPENINFTEDNSKITYKKNTIKKFIYTMSFKIYTKYMGRYLKNEKHHKKINGK